MRHPFDSGYVAPPFDALAQEYPGADVYPPDAFRIEWGPIFHRGRLDGSARLLVIGQDPGQHECVVRRILVGAAGQRVQGFLAKLGIESSYVMVNAFVYCVFGQHSADRHRDDPGIVAYRHRWFDALLVGSQVEAVVSFGTLADRAFRAWRRSPAGAALDLPYQALPHPTSPESSAGDDLDRLADATKRMLRRWNAGLEHLAGALAHPDVVRELVPYGDSLTAGDLVPIPPRDLPAGLPAWMGSIEPWAVRDGETVEEKRASLRITVPQASRPWTPLSG
jgi:hypothetical protein